MYREWEGLPENFQAQNPYSKEVQVAVSPKRRLRAGIALRMGLSLPGRQSAPGAVHLRESFQESVLYQCAYRNAIMAV